jgi:4-hydroxythreonine-4-phosphate dehydrogenase
VKPIVAITQGDPNGIGPEVALRAALSPSVRRLCTPVLVGHPGAFFHYARAFGLRSEFTLFQGTALPDRFRRGPIPIVIPETRRTLRVAPGRTTRMAGRSAADALLCAAGLALDGRVDAIVTAPVSKRALHRAGAPYPGQTEFLQDLTGSDEVAMMLVADNVRIGLATIHIPVRRIAAALRTDLLLRRLRVIHSALRNDWAIRVPRLGVLGLNPHAGEDGDLGDEEGRVITPALRRARAAGMAVDGPFPADAFFARKAYRRFDAVVAMYHDQGLIPLKMLAGGRGVNVSVGLPIVRTSPDHGTAFDIAGRGVADPGSMAEAIAVACTIARNRRTHHPS